MNKVEKTEGNDQVKEVLILLLLLGLSLVSVFGVYNTFTVDLVDIINRIEVPGERYANYAILGVFVVLMAALQGVNMKKKDLVGKAGVVLGVLAGVGVILALIFFFTNSIVYPVLGMLTTGVTIYMLGLVFRTIGVMGFAFFLALFGAGIIMLYKHGHQDISFLVTITEVAFAMLLFVAATYPRIKSAFFRIGTRDNVDISNSDDDHGEE